MQRNHPRLKWAVPNCLALLGLCWANGLVLADGGSNGGSQAKKTAPKDPVAMAFTLPHGVTLDAKQQKAYKKLKSQYESPLRSAIGQVQSKDKDESAKGVKQSREIRAKIKTGIKDILAMSSSQPRSTGTQTSTAGSQRAAGGGNCPCGR
jgi:hypothetical protein